MPRKRPPAFPLNRAKPVKTQDFQAWLEHMGFDGYGGNPKAAEALGVSIATLKNYKTGAVVIPHSVDLACAALAQGIRPWSEYKR
jgi:hypothetical protein